MSLAQHRECATPGRALLPHAVACWTEQCHREEPCPAGTQGCRRSGADAVLFRWREEGIRVQTCAQHAAHLLAVVPGLRLAAHVGSTPVLWWGCRAPARSASSGRRDGGSLKSSLAQVALAAAVLLEVGDAAAGHLAHLQTCREESGGQHQSCTGGPCSCRAAPRWQYCRGSACTPAEMTRGLSVQQQPLCSPCSCRAARSLHNAAAGSPAHKQQHRRGQANSVPGGPQVSESGASCSCCRSEG